MWELWEAPGGTLAESPGFAWPRVYSNFSQISFSLPKCCSKVRKFEPAESAGLHRPAPLSYAAARRSPPKAAAWDMHDLRLQPYTVIDTQCVRTRVSVSASVCVQCGDAYEHVYDMHKMDMRSTVLYIYIYMHMHARTDMSTRKANATNPTQHL